MSNPLLWGGPMEPPEYWAETCPVCDTDYLPGRYVRHECSDDSERMLPASWLWDNATVDSEGEGHE